MWMGVQNGSRKGDLDVESADRNPLGSLTRGPRRAALSDLPGETPGRGITGVGRTDGRRVGIGFPRPYGNSKRPFAAFVPAPRTAAGRATRRTPRMEIVRSANLRCNPRPCGCPLSPSFIASRNACIEMSSRRSAASPLLAPRAAPSLQGAIPRERDAVDRETFAGVRGRGRIHPLPGRCGTR